MAPADLTPFVLAVPDEELEDLRRRLASTRWPDQLAPPANDKWAYGTEREYLRGLAGYWADGFGWRAQERALNAMPQFTATVRGARLHFVHQRCADAAAPALLLSHGWPGSVFEFHKVLRPLARHFHVIAPSIPGYGFSAPPTAPGFSMVEVARTFHALMLDLGYAEYVAQGGDWGSAITRTLGVLFPGNCKAIHVNMAYIPTARRLKEFKNSQLTPAELAQLERTKAFMKHGVGYQAIQGTRPQTLSYGLNDSPVGLLAWIVEKFRDWSDCGGDVETAFTRDEILTNVMIYWCSGSIGSSARLYYESGAGGQAGPATVAALQQMAGKKGAPAAVAVFPFELAPAPRAWCEASYDLKRYTTFPRGGHFAALERPAELAADVTAFFIDDLGLGVRRGKL